jgi:protein-disulfide isomerase
MRNRPEWRNGRRRGLKIPRPLRVCGFDSHLRHHAAVFLLFVAARVGAKRGHLAVPYRPMSSKAIQAAAVGLLLAVGCSSSAVQKPATATTTTTTNAGPSPAPEETAALTPQELIALERTPGKTPSLAQSIEPATLPVARIGGTPGTSPAYGREDAPVRIFLFTDFQCPVCPRVVEPIKYLARAYPKDVRIVLKENALASHGRAARAAAASLAAFRQGKFWEFHDRVFASSGQLEDTDLVAHAQALGLDVARFQRDMDDEAVTAQVTYESELATSLGLGSTPGLVVNGTLQKGWGSYMSLESLVKRELDRARTIAAGGVPANRVAYEATRQSGPKGEELAAALFTGPN